MLIKNFFSESLIQNVSELSQSKFTARCDEMLNMLDKSQSVKLEGLIWEIPFSHKGYKECNAKLDFTPFEQPELQFTESVTLNLEANETVELSIIGFAKWFFLEQVHINSADYRLTWNLERLKMLFAFLTERQEVILRVEDIEDYFSLLLTHDFPNNDFVKRFSIPSYGARFKSLDLSSMNRILLSYKVEVLLERIDKSVQDDALNNACIAQANMTLSDYKSGGSFDFLGLDVGRHYVDYCADIFENFTPYATACRKTINDISLELEQDKKLKAEDKVTLLKQLSITLLGECNEIKRILIYKNQPITKKVKAVFHQHYNEIIVTQKAFTLDTITAIVDELGLPETRFDTHEFTRSMLFTRFYGNKLKARESICSEYKASLLKDGSNDEIDFKWEVAEFDAICDKHLRNHTINIDKVNEICSCNSKALRQGKVNNNLDALLKDVEAAGVTCFTAYTGWRASEFGFPVSAISIVINNDILDSVYCPFRFYVNWIAPKTSGETLLEREITLSTCVISKQLAELNCSHDKAALVSRKFSNTTTLRRIIADEVSRLWSIFPYHYKPFVVLDELQFLLEIQGELKGEEKNRLLYLMAQYDLDNSSVKELILLRDRLKSESLLRELSQRSYTINGSTVRFSETLRRYLSGELNKKDAGLINANLSEDTKVNIFHKGFSLEREAVNAVRLELLEDTYNVTPHAFRHMWAEAVLRRYRGDVGRFIRVHFKHLDERFFMAYLRNKETKAIYEVAKRTTINSTVRKHVARMGDNKRPYAGSFDRFISKAISMTKVVSHEEYVTVANQISNNRIIDIKVNPWATCLLRIGTQAIAKCSEDGIPQRHNAAPEFCLGCINADIESGNYIGIVAYTKVDVEACRNSELPFSIKKRSLEVVLRALKRVEELRDNSAENRYDSFIKYLKETVEIARKSKEK